MRVLVCGDREWNDPGWIRMVLSTVKSVAGSVIVIEGECRGADRIARYIAEELELEVVPFPANWKKHGKAAGFIRNHQMLIEGKPDLVLAFHNYLENSKGTSDMIKQAENAGIPTWRNTDGQEWLLIRLREATLRCADQPKAN